MTENLMDIGPFGEWLRYGERGISSESIVTVLTGVPIRPQRSFGLLEPADPADFRRCERLLRTVEKFSPEVRAHFAAAMPKVSEKWAALVARWNDIAALIEAEAPGVLDGTATGKAPKAFALMSELRFPATKENNR